MLNQIIQGDCLELMTKIPSHTIDLIATDLPYGTTACKWDAIIPLDALWEQWRRILKPDGAIVLTANQPFTSILVTSNLDWFKFEMIWTKHRATGFLGAKKSPLRKHENVLIFSPKPPKYTPQMEIGKPYVERRFGNRGGVPEYVSGEKTRKEKDIVTVNNGLRYPTTLIDVVSDNQTGNSMHPTQKPVALFEYLIKTYSNPGDLVLDICAGSGTTALAAHSTGRQFLCFEKEPKYVEIANKRLALAQMQGRFEEMVG